MLGLMGCKVRARSKASSSAALPSLARCLDRSALGDGHLFDASGFGRGQFVLHLHGLDHDQALAQGNFVAWLHEDPHDAARHGGVDALLTGRVTQRGDTLNI